MTTESVREKKYVVGMFLTIGLLVLGSLITEFNMIDVCYLVFTSICCIRYLYIKKTEE